MKKRASIFLVLLLFVFGIVDVTANSSLPRAIDSVGYLRPSSGSFTRISPGGSVNIYSWVHKAGVTDGPGQGAGISCEVYWSTVYNFGGDWVDIHTTPMAYNTTIDINDDYKGVLSSLTAGKYEFTTRCTDDGGTSWAWANLPNGNGMIEVGSIEDGIIIPGSSPGTNTGIFLSNGEPIKILASGSVNTWYDNPENLWGGPDGNGWPCTSECLLPSAQFGALIGRIGVDGQWFFIGSDNSINADRSGELIIAVNDNVYHGDNIGAYIILTERRSCPIPFFSQRDPRWINHPLRTNGVCSPSCSTIGACGCTLTSATMLFAHYGTDLLPSALSDCMGTSACPFYWKVSASCTNGKAQWVNSYPFSWDRLDQELNQNSHPVILGMHKKGNPNNTHWVLVIAGQGSDPTNYSIHDPWFWGGANMKLSARTRDYDLDWLSVYQGQPECNTRNSSTLNPESLHPKPVLLSPNSDTMAQSQQKLYSSEPMSSTVITGTAIVYRMTEFTMTIQLTAQSSAGHVTGMLIWTDTLSNTTWQPYATFAWLPISESVYALFRDEFGNVSGSFSDTIYPENTPANLLYEVYLPLALKFPPALRAPGTHIQPEIRNKEKSHEYR